VKRLALVLLASSCATTSQLKTGWLEPTQLAFDKERYADDAAVILYRADRTLLDTKGGQSTELMRHVAIAVLREGGFDLAEVKVPYNTRHELLVLRARVLQPDGSVRELDGKDILSDTNGKGDRDTQSKFFRFPDVRVGSVLEYFYVIRMPWVMGYDDQDTLGAFPVKHYDFELTGSRVLPLETIEYNSKRPIEVTTLNDGSTRLRFSLDDLPPRPREEWMPNWTYTEPRWAWRVLGYKVSTQVTNNWYRDWNDVVEGVARKAYVESATFKGFDARPPLDGCSDAKCKVMKATDWLREKTSTLGIDTNRDLVLAEAFASGQASARERAMMLRFVLEKAGVEAKLAFTTEALSRQTAKSFPELAQFNRLMVWVPAQPSLPQPIAIDLEAEYCTAGQLPSLVNQQPAYVFWMVGGVVGEGEAAGEWVQLDGSPCVQPLRRDRHQATLDADGHLTDTITVEAEGSFSPWWQRSKRDWTAKQFAREMDSRSSGIARISTPKEWKWLDCDRLKGRCVHSLTTWVPNYAVRDGSSWLVPLNALTRFFQGTFDSEVRHGDVHIAQDSGVREEVFELTVPKGFHATKLPDVMTDSAPGLSVRVTAERTANGLKVTRRLSFAPGIYDKAEYPKLRKTLERFQSVRNTVLQLDPD